jgi:signal transduction histidine kinase
MGELAYSKTRIGSGGKMHRQLALPQADPAIALNRLPKPVNDAVDEAVKAVADHGLPARNQGLSLEQSTTPVEQLLRVHEYERQRLGQELHDSAGQLVVSLLLSVARLKTMEQGLGQGIVIDEISEIVRQIDVEIRSLAFLHYPAELGGRSLCGALERLAFDFGRRTRIHTSFRSVGSPPLLDRSVSTALLRVTQEALVNVHRHSHAASARIVVKSRPGEIELHVSDDGIGIARANELTKSGGIGLSGMRHRIESLGGRFGIRGLKPGTMICARVPVAA